MKFEAWYLLLGALMLAVTFLDRFVKRLPITTTIVYLAVGIAIGPSGFGWAVLDPVENSKLLERLTEIAVIISLFTAGLKLRARNRDPRWRVPIRLASLSMLLTVGLIALFASVLLQMPIGEAILLGAILAPTDPVLASDVQLEHPGDRDRLRFGLTGEAGFNDGTAFPFVMLGLGLMGLHPIGAAGWRWFSVDLVWAVVGGLVIGTVLGTLVGRFVIYLRNRHAETAGRDEFISFGLIAISYGTALYLHTYGFLAVFAAGMALRQIEIRTDSPERSVEPEEPSRGPVDPDQPQHPADIPVLMASSVLAANEQLERLFEVALIMLLGMMLSLDFWTWQATGLAAALFFLIRPIAVVVGTVRTNITPLQKWLMGWFGIRGIGSIYYLMFAVTHGVPKESAEVLTGLVLCVITMSILVHGISVTPIMNRYEEQK